MKGYAVCRRAAGLGTHAPSAEPGVAAVTKQLAHGRQRGSWALLAAMVLSAGIVPALATPLPDRATQGQLVVASVQPGEQVWVGNRALRVDADGRYVFGIARDAASAITVRIRHVDGHTSTHRLRVTPRDWPIERVDGVPPRTVDPPPDIAARIAREQSRVAEARSLDSALDGFGQSFIWPVSGRISGRFGSERRYNGKHGSPHSGMDIAAPAGTPVRAPASGRVIFADRDLYLTGGTLVIDDGHGVSSVFLHLSRLDVAVGDRIDQGQVIAAVGATGRASGPHLHWGMNWFDTRLDPLLVVPAPATHRP